MIRPTNAALLACLLSSLTLAAGEKEPATRIPACDTWVKLVRCKIDHQNEASRQKLLKDLDGQLSGMRKTLRRKGPAGKRKMAAECLRSLDAFKTQERTRPWFEGCLTGAVMDCPAWTEPARDEKASGTEYRCLQKGKDGQIRPHGPHLVFLAGKILQESSYRKGEMHGRFVQWHQTGPGHIKTIGHYRRGKKHGAWIYFNPHGQKLAEETWRNGKKKKAAHF